ncbi:MAG: ArsR family transcriptional regulator [Promethearchaeota archaeon]|nr:MAG: ArsR family transcriptional regulator [Candidatus Lokiarchaeota archaeon]
MEDIIEDVVNLLKVLADNTRLSILKMLNEKKMYANDIQDELDKSQSTISQQLGILFDADIITYEKNGKKNLYSIKNHQIMKILAALQRNILNQRKEKLKDLSDFDIYDTLF